MQIIRSWKALLTLGTALSLAGCLRAPATDTQPQAQNAPQQGNNQPPVVVDGSGTTPGDTGPMQAIPAGQDNHHLLLGNPSKAGTDPNNYLVERPQHALSYSKSNGGPNWVAWHLDKSDLGNVRRGDFLPDPLLPPDMQIRPSDYRNSGYDRGHVCPSGDRTSSKADNTATFVMSNMLPQAAALNQQVWKDLEEYERSLAKTNELYIVAGGAGSAERIGNGKVNVPTVCWKILVVLPPGNNDLQRIGANTRVIAVSMPNREQQAIADSKWTDWITTVTQIEKTTGYDFLSALPDNVERALEQKKDSGRASSASRSRSGDGSLFARQERESDSLAVAPVVAPVVVAEPRSVSTSRTSSPPAAEASQHQTAVQGAIAGQVWVNTNSGIYHYPGARWYGNTKQGVYLSEQEAIAQGYRAARNGQ